jgi:hypothetical protein
MGFAPKMTLVHKDGHLINAESQDGLELFICDFVEGREVELSRIPALPCSGLEKFH